MINKKVQCKKCNIWSVEFADIADVPKDWRVLSFQNVGIGRITHVLCSKCAEALGLPNDMTDHASIKTVGDLLIDLLSEIAQEAMTP